MRVCKSHSCLMWKPISFVLILSSISLYFMRNDTFNGDAISGYFPDQRQVQYATYKTKRFRFQLHWWIEDANRLHSASRRNALRSDYACKGSKVWVLRLPPLYYSRSVTVSILPTHSSYPRCFKFTFPSRRQPQHR